MKPKRNHCRRNLFPRDPKDPAFLVQFIIVKGMRGQHGGSLIVGRLCRAYRSNDWLCLQNVTEKLLDG
jgi:hypothetical protein